MKAEFPLQVGRIELPTAVGQGGATALDRTGNGDDCGRFPRNDIMAAEECSDGQPSARVVGDPQMLDLPDAVSIQERQACIGAADICQ